MTSAKNLEEEWPGPKATNSLVLMLTDESVFVDISIYLTINAASNGTPYPDVATPSLSTDPLIVSVINNFIIYFMLEI